MVSVVQILGFLIPSAREALQERIQKNVKFGQAGFEDDSMRNGMASNHVRGSAASRFRSFKNVKKELEKKDLRKSWACQDMNNAEGLCFEIHGLSASVVIAVFGLIHIDSMGWWPPSPSPGNVNMSAGRGPFVVGKAESKTLNTQGIPVMDPFTTF
ncbi:hypothetical protein CB1_001616098 [Camelus ferus]|nr:hypothetical protein CB1_001616098 [Camelus ferus]